ncbi:chemotaxis protein CheY [alpha proteobacterium AAP81b]|nr:chemotaxis protein CheY [alpha proteobacterium AAP81b]
MPIRTIIVDDERLAIQGLELRLAAFDDIEIVERCANGREAIRAIKTLKPDLVFLDIQMPGFDGFSVVAGLADIEPPLFVFVTAYGEHALKAFEAQAVDYLMKPVDEDRLATTVDRVRQRLAERRSSVDTERLKEILSEVAPDAVPEDMVGDGEPAANRFEKILNIKDRGQIFRVDVNDIERIDAAGDYMCIYTADQTLILRETMKDLEKRLDPRKFQRIHRSTIVNLDNIKSVKPHTNGECFLVLQSNTQVKVSRSYREVVARFL